MNQSTLQLSRKTWSRVCSRGHARPCIAPLRPGADRSGTDVRSGDQFKAAWHGAELLGRVLGGSPEEGPSALEAAGAALVAQEPITWKEALDEVRADYESNYFVSGNAAMAAYEPDCEFSDPFTSFKGVGRFKRNLSNFGRLIEGVDVAVTKWEELREHELRVSWRFKCFVKLPWRPVLAAAGSTTYIGNPESGRICKHIEAWDAKPGDVLARLLRPGKR